MFHKSNTQIVTGAAGWLVEGVRLGHVLAVLMAVAIACVALTGSPAMAAAKPLDSRTSAVEQCMPSGYDDPTADVDREDFAAAFGKAAICILSAVDPKGSSPDDPNGTAKSNLAAACPVTVIMEFGGSPNYAGVILIHSGANWVSIVIHNDGHLEVSKWNDGSGGCGA